MARGERQSLSKGPLQIFWVGERTSLVAKLISDLQKTPPLCTYRVNRQRSGFHRPTLITRQGVVYFRLLPRDIPIQPLKFYRGDDSQVVQCPKSQLSPVRSGMEVSVCLDFITLVIVSRHTAHGLAFSPVSAPGCRAVAQTDHPTGFTASHAKVVGPER